MRIKKITEYIDLYGNHADGAYELKDIEELFINIQRDAYNQAIDDAAESVELSHGDKTDVPEYAEIPETATYDDLENYSWINRESILKLKIK